MCIICERKKSMKNRAMFSKIIRLFLVFIFCLFYKCPFKLFLHIECPGCGMTRAILAALRLEFRTAFQYHPLFPVVFLVGVYYVFQTQFRNYLHMGNRQEQFLLFLICMIFLGRWGIRMLF